MRSIACSLMMVSLLAGCPQEETINPKLHSTADAAADYFPFVKDAKWVYVSTIGAKSTESVHITSVEKSGDKETAHLSRAYSNEMGDSWVTTETYIKSKDGIDLANERVTPFSRFAYFPLATGTIKVAAATSSVYSSECGDRHIELSDIDVTTSKTSSLFSNDCYRFERTFVEHSNIYGPCSANSVMTRARFVTLGAGVGPVEFGDRIDNSPWAISTLATYSIPSQ